MGWRFKWVSSHSNDFNYDYHVSYTNNEIAAGKVYYNYAYMYLDLTPKGRNETGPHHNLGDWVRHHDRYDAGGTVNHQG
jgi:predicted dithiol-disulfide oxidoreductase (DUF899 family)